MRTVRTAVPICLLLLIAAPAGAGTISFLPGFTDNFGFTPQSTVDITGPTDNVAIMKQNPLTPVVELYNDPFVKHSHAVILTGAVGKTLSFDWELYEFGTQTGNKESFRFVLTHGTAGSTPDGAVEVSTTVMPSSGTWSFDLSPWAGKAIGLRFELRSDVYDPYTNGHLNVMDLRTTMVPVPAAGLAALPLLAAAILWRRFRRKR